MRRLFKILFIIALLAWGAAGLRHSFARQEADSGGARPRHELVERTPVNFNGVTVQTEQQPQTAGEPIRFSRTRGGLSQLELSLDANVRVVLCVREGR